MKKKILVIVAVLVVLLIAGLVVAGLSLDGLVKRSVETVGPRFTKVDVKLDAVKLSLLSGGGEVNGLVIGNPEGFKTPHAIRVGSSRLVVQPASLMSDKVVVRVVRVEAPEITLEAGLNGTNLKKILNNLNETTGGGKDTTATPAPASNEPGKKLQVDDFLITGAKLNLNLTGVAAAGITLPDIHLTNLGQGPEGITGAELMKRVLTEVERVAAKVAAEHAGDLVKGASGLVKGLAGTNSAAAEQLGKGIGDLFKKK
ncbi:MAG: hypothetical protein U1F65_01270 [Verrucomicrobiota bacterium]